MSGPADQIYANCVAIGDVGILLRGESGSGKSDLSLRLMHADAVLVADDRTDVRREGAFVYASAPQPLRGLMEVRGLGILPFDYKESVRLAAVVDLQDQQKIERVPESKTTEILGCDLPCFQIDPALPSAVIKVTLVSGLVSGSITRTDD